MPVHDPGSDEADWLSDRRTEDLQVRYCDCLWRVLQAEHEFQTPVPENFPGFVVSRGGISLAAAGCSCEPDGTLAVTMPLLTPAADPREQVLLANTLFSEMIRHARQRGLRAIHCLVPGDDPAWSARSGHLSAASLLQECGLGWMATIVRQTRLLGDSASTISCRGELEGRSLSCSRTAPDIVLAQPRSSGTVRELLRIVLEDSLDLPVAMRPSAEELLGMWQQRLAEVLVVSRNERPVAIAAVSGHNRGEPASLEYIGVHPAERHAGIGRGVLRLAEQTVLETAAASGRTAPCFLNAYADEANLPAMRLYAGCGYLQAERLQLYSLSLSAEPTTGALPEPDVSHPGNSA